MEFLLTGELDGPLPLLVEDEDEYLLIAKAAQLDGLFQEATLSFAECNIALVLVFDQLELVNFLFTHI